MLMVVVEMTSWERVLLVLWCLGLLPLLCKQSKHTPLSHTLCTNTMSLVIIHTSPSLTWRDVQYLVAYTSKRDHLKYTGDWKQNGAGLWISRSFGFGAIDTEALVTRARNWINVPEQLSYSIQPEWSNG